MLIPSGVDAKKEKNIANIKNLSFQSRIRLEPALFVLLAC